MIRRLAWLLVASAVLLPPMAAAAQDVVEYYGTDAIGSVRIVFDANGNIVGRMDYGPFGEQVTVSTVGQKSYAGLFRDGEAGLDYAEARSYQVRTGRFNAPDPVYAGMFATQAWNRYSYALNSPLAFVDPTGLAADSCVMKEFRLDGDKTTMAYDCSVTGGGGGPSWNLSLFSFSGGSFFGQRGAGSGRADDAQGAGRGKEPVEPKTPASPDRTETIDETGPTVVDTLGEFVAGCAEGLAGFVDGVIPFGDPLMSSGAYDAGSPADWFSQTIGEGVRDFAAGEFGSGALLGWVATKVGAAARLGNQAARTVSNNRFLRLGFGRGEGMNVPMLRLGNFSSDWGKYLSHVNLRPGQAFSKTAPGLVKRIQRCIS